MKDPDEESVHSDQESDNLDDGFDFVKVAA